jgi:hypothetical protein
MILYLAISLVLLLRTVVVQIKRIPLQNVIASILVVAVTVFIFGEVGLMWMTSQPKPPMDESESANIFWLSVPLWAIIGLNSRSAARGILSRSSGQAAVGLRTVMLAVSLGTIAVVCIEKYGSSKPLIIPFGGQPAFLFNLLENLVIQIAITPWMIIKKPGINT